MGCCISHYCCCLLGGSDGWCFVHPIDFMLDRVSVDYFRKKGISVLLQVALTLGRSVCGNVSVEKSVASTLLVFVALLTAGLCFLHAWGWPLLVSAADLILKCEV